MVNIENLIKLATLVRDETANKQNTALRVGGTFLEVVYAIRYLLETVGVLDTLAKGLVTRTRFFHGSAADVDALKNKTDLGVYVATTTGWTGLLSVQFDFYSNVSQVALSSSTPDYSEGSLVWKPAPCVMFRTYTNGAWSAWRKAGADVVNDLVAGGKDKALSAEQGKMLYQMVAVLVREIEKIAGGNIGTLLLLKKINGDGLIEDASGAVNRTLKADVSNYNGKEATIGGRLYKSDSANTYCWWAFHDADGNVLEKSATTTSSGIDYSNVKITIPNGAKYLYVQGNTTVLPTAQVYPFIRETIDEHTQDIAQLKDEVIIKGDNIVETPDFTLDKTIYNSTGLWSDVNLNRGSYVFNVKAGDKYQIQANINYKAYVHLLTSVDITVAPQYMSGTEKIVIPIGEIATVDIPQVGYMLVIRDFYTTGHGEYLPSAIYKVQSVKDSIKGYEKRFENIEEGSYSQIKYSILPLKKITSDGLIEDASGAANRTLKADITDYIGKTLKLDGKLYKVTNGITYCWWVFHDADGNVIEKSETSKSQEIFYNNVSVVVPNGAVTLYVSGVETFMPNAKAMIGVVLDNLIDEGFADNTEKTTRTFPLDLASLSNSTGRVATFGGYTNDSCRHTIDYIKVHKSIIIKNLQNITINVRVHFFDKDLSFLGNTLYVDSENGLAEINVENIPGNAVWFRISLATDNTSYPNKVKYPRFEVDIESEWGSGVETTKDSYVAYQPFIYGVKSNVPIKIAEHSYSTKTVLGYDEGLIHLPQTYSPNGKPTPVIIFIHGDAERYTIGESTFSGHMKMQQCWSDAGFAQVDLDLIPSNWGNPSLPSSGGTRDDLECLCAAWKWLTNNFNVDASGFYLIGRSRGGQCVFEILGKGGATKLPIIAAISMAGANSPFAYSLVAMSNRTEPQWQMWCNSRGLPVENRPSWGSSSYYNTSKSFLIDPAIYNYVSSNFDLWSKKELTGWGLITKNTDNITPRDWFDNFVYPFALSGRVYTTAIEEFFMRMKNTMEAKSPIPLRLDWCVGDTIQPKEYFVSTPHSYASVFSEILLSTPASNVEYRRWPGVDAENPYGETDPHYAENMIFYDGDLVLPNGAVTHNPSKVAMEWLVWCMGKDTRFQGIEYTLPWQ